MSEHNTQPTVRRYWQRCGSHRFAVCRRHSLRRMYHCHDSLQCTSRRTTQHKTHVKSGRLASIHAGSKQHTHVTFLNNASKSASIFSLMFFSYEESSPIWHFIFCKISWKQRKTEFFGGKLQQRKLQWKWKNIFESRRSHSTVSVTKSSFIQKTLTTSNSAVTKRLCDASCLSVVSFNSTKRQVFYC